MGIEVMVHDNTGISFFWRFKMNCRSAYENFSVLPFRKAVTYFCTCVADLSFVDDLPM